MLVDSREAIVSCLARAMADCGLRPLTAAEAASLIGPPLGSALGELLGPQVGPPEVAACVERYREIYARESVPLSRVFPGIPAALEVIGAARPLAVATSKPRRLAIPLLRGLGLASRFQAIAGPELGAEREPKAATVKRLLGELEGPAEALIGDTVYDVRAAHAHGLRAIGVAWGMGSPAELLAAGAERVVGQPGELLRAL